MLNQIINIVIIFIFIYFLYYNTWKTLKFLLFFSFILFIIAILNAKKLLPVSIAKILSQAKNSIGVIKFITLIIYAFPCLIENLFHGSVNEYKKQPRGMAYIIFALICLFLIIMLFPCFIRWIYTANPFGSWGHMKSSMIQRMNNFKKASEDLTQKIWIRRISTPNVKWTENWITSDDKTMQEALTKLGYKNTTRKSRGIKSASLKGFISLCKSYVEPSLFRGTWNLKKALDKDLTYPMPSIPDAIKLIRANYVDMRNDLQALPKINFEYLQLLKKADTYLDTYTTKQLINEPIYTDIETTNEKWYYENLKDGKVYNYSYAISFWIFIHEQPLGHSDAYRQFTSLFNYGGKPNILYHMGKQRFRITMHDNKETERIIYETDNMTMQTWNNIVVNYNGGTLDVYINNKLVASEGNIVPYVSQDKITLGHKNGLSGGICNVIYYPGSLSPLKISLFYETLKNRNPPILPTCLV